MPIKATRQHRGWRVPYGAIIAEA